MNGNAVLKVKGVTVFAGLLSRALEMYRHLEDQKRFAWLATEGSPGLYVGLEIEKLLLK